MTEIIAHGIASPPVWLYQVKPFDLESLGHALDRHARARRGVDRVHPRDDGAERVVYGRPRSGWRRDGRDWRAHGACWRRRHRRRNAGCVTWLVAAVVAAPIGLAATIIKARRHHVALWSASGRRFMQGFLPSIVAGAALTVALVRADRIELLPPTWLLLYGAGILAGATASISVLDWVGARCSWRSASPRPRPSVSGRTLARRGIWRIADRLRHHHHEETWRLGAVRRTVTRHRPRPTGQARPNEHGRARRRRRPRHMRSISID